MALWNFCEHRTIWGWKFQNATPPTVFIWFEPNFMISKAVIGKYTVMDILAICQNLKILWQFEILTCESIGRPRKSIGKSWKWPIAERNGQKLGTWGTTLHIYWVYFWCLIPWVWFWGHVVQFAKFLILWFSKWYSFNSFHHISTKLHTKYHNQGLI